MSSDADDDDLYRFSVQVYFAVCRGRDMKEHIFLFTVDGAELLAVFFYLEENNMNFQKLSLKETLHTLIDLPDKAKILDLGCRNAEYLISFLEVYPNRIEKAVGVDVTNKGFATLPYKAPIELKVMNCDESLDFPDGEFDLVFTKDLLECIPDKTRLIREIHRVLKPGGAVLCVHTDFDSIIYNGKNKTLLTKAVHAYAETKQGWMDTSDDWMGRRLYGCFNASGLFDGDVSVYNLIETNYTEGSMGYQFSRLIGFLTEDKVGVLSKDEYEDFLEELVRADEKGEYFFNRPYYIYKGARR